MPAAQNKAGINDELNVLMMNLLIDKQATVMCAVHWCSHDLSDTDL